MSGARSALPRSALHGLRIAVTRPAAGAAVLAHALREAGAAPVLIPLTRILPPVDEEPLRSAARRVGQYDWIIFTSANAVRAFANVLPRSPSRSLAGRIAAVGPVTAAAVETAFGRPADVIPDEFSGTALIDAMAGLAQLDGCTVLWPRAEAALESLAQGLTDHGARLEVPVAYRTECDRDAARTLARFAAIGTVDVLTFAAPSAVRCYDGEGVGIGDAVVAVIGTTTAAAARECGLPVHVQPDEHTAAALAAVLAARFRVLRPEVDRDSVRGSTP